MHVAPAFAFPRFSSTSSSAVSCCLRGDTPLSFVSRLFVSLWICFALVLFPRTLPAVQAEACCNHTLRCYFSLPLLLLIARGHAARSMNNEGGLSGKGESGMGTTRGRASFDSFTHRKVVAIQAPNFDPLAKYPPYGVSFL